MRAFKFLAVVIFMLFFQNSHAQTEKNSFLLGGSASFYFSNPGNDYEGFVLNINPDIGYFVLKNLAIGLDFYYQYSYYYLSSNSADHQNSYTYSLQPFVRYYIIGEKLKPFLLGSYGLSRYHQKTTLNLINNNDSYTLNKHPYCIGIGVDYFINHSVGLEIKLQYSKNTNIMSPYSNSTLGLYIGLQIFFSK